MALHFSICPLNSQKVNNDRSTIGAKVEMTKLMKIWVVILFVVMGVCLVSTRETQAKPMRSAEMTSPRSLYIQNCARCHGSNGKAQTREGRRLEADDLTTSDAKDISDAKLRRIITNGRGKMPAFGKRLNSSQITQIMGYVRSL
jgi:cytochrome c6